MSQKFGALISSVTLMALGALADHYLVAKVTAPTALEESPLMGVKPDCEKAENDLGEIKRKLSGLTPEEVQSYLNSNSAEEKLKKADELLAKVMQVFVADLGLHLSPSDLEKFGHLPAAAPQQPVDTQPTPPPPPAATTTAPKPELEGRKRHRLIVNVLAEDQAKRFLKSLAQEDFGQALKASGNLTSEMIRQLRGHFLGSITFTNNRTPWRAEMTFDGSIQGPKVLGNYQVLLSDSISGKKFSDSKGNGSLENHFQAYNEAILIEVGGDYLELFYFPALDQLIGSFLEVAKGEYHRVGTVVLRRD